MLSAPTVWGACSDCAKRKPPKPGSVAGMLLTVRKQAAEQKYKEAEALARKAGARAGRDPMLRARALSELGYVLSCESKYPEAKAAYDESIRLRRPRVKTVAEMDAMAAELQALAGLQRRALQRGAARKSMDAATDMVAKAHGKDAQITQLFRNAARAFPQE